MSARIAFALALFAAGSLPAQSLPPIRQSKESAIRAVEATNAHTATMTADQSGSMSRRAAPSPSDSLGQAGRATQTATGTTAIPNAVERPATTLEREVFSYSSAGRRDPFVSLMASGDLVPVITDLRVTTILYDPAGRNSVAVLRDLTNKEQYRVKVGQSIGRIRVARIDPKSVTFTIEEFGFSRQETLALGDPNKERTQ
jgi:hypothetical protein